jgi:hypothetical protein
MEIKIIKSINKLLIYFLKYRIMNDIDDLRNRKTSKIKNNILFFYILGEENSLEKNNNINNNNTSSIPFFDKTWKNSNKTEKNENKKNYPNNLININNRATNVFKNKISDIEIPTSDTEENNYSPLTSNNLNHKNNLIGNFSLNNQKNYQSKTPVSNTSYNINYKNYFISSPTNTNSTKNNNNKITNNLINNNLINNLSRQNTNLNNNNNNKMNFIVYHNTTFSTTSDSSNQYQNFSRSSEFNNNNMIQYNLINYYNNYNIYPNMKKDFKSSTMNYHTSYNNIIPQTNVYFANTFPKYNGSLNHINQLNISQNSKNSNDSNLNNSYNNKENKINIEDILNKKEFRTTVMIKNFPKRYNVENLINEIDKKLNITTEKENKNYDFIYFPKSYVKDHSSLSYAFINFIHPLCIIELYTKFNGFKFKNNSGHKECILLFANYQGKEGKEELLAKKNNEGNNSNDGNSNCNKPIEFKVNFDKIRFKIPFQYESIVRENYSNLLNKIDFENYIGKKEKK